MGRAGRGSIGGKLARLVVTAVACATLFMLGVGLWQEAARALSAKRESLLATAGAFAAASAASVAAHDVAGATRALRGIGGVADLSYGAIEDAAGVLVAEIGSGARLSGDLQMTAREPGGNAFDLLFTRSVAVTAPIVQNGERVGRLRLIGTIADLEGRLVAVLVSTVLSGLAALVIGLAVSLGLQRSITRPIVALTQSIRTIQASQNYALRVEIRGNDEICVLARNFNDLLAKMDERDRRLVTHRDRLEQDVAERTRDLALAMQRAEAANAAKSAFLATMSHEIRTPMNGMLVMAELLAASDLPQRQRRYAEVIARSGQSLMAIINDILDVSKIEAGMLTLETVAFSPTDVVDAVVTLFGERAAEKGIDLAVCVAPDVPLEVEGDPARVTQVLSNLLGNALKFTSRGHVLITVAADARTSLLRFSVADTGIGIASAKLGSIFAAFTQADESTTRRFGGTGLGLSICKRLAEAMGGDIVVESLEGRGSTFVFSMKTPLTGALPEIPDADPERPVHVSLEGSATRRAVRSALEAAGSSVCDGSSASHDLIVDAAALVERGTRGGASRIVAVAAMEDAAGVQAINRGLADCVIRRPIVQSEWRTVLMRLRDGLPFELDRRAAADQRPPTSRFAGANVLVVDDSAVNREVACAALARLGIVADAVADGGAALAALASSRYDLVLMDGSMPDLDGFETTRRLRHEENTAGKARTPVVALTAHVIGAASEAWREAGMDGVLHKPFTVARLEACLQAHLPEAAVVPAVEPAAKIAPPPLSGEASVELLDRETLASLAELAQASPGGGFLGRIIGLFAEGAPHAMAELQVAADGATAASAAHKLKSMSLNIGAARLAARLRGIEHGAREHGRLPVDADLDGVDSDLTATLAALQAWLDLHAPRAASAAA